MSFKKNVLGFKEGLVAAQRRVVRFADHWPGFLPAFGKVLPHRLRVLVAANHPIGVVVELNEARAPDNTDRQVGGQTDAHCRTQALWPPCHRPQRGV